MKKMLYCAVALAMAFFAGSCQQEKLEPVAGNGTVTFTVEAPANVQTKAIADGQNVDQLVYEVWLTPTIGTLDGGQKLYQAETEMVSDGTVNKATLTLDLVNDQKFTVLFWAQVDAANAYITDELTAVTYAKDKYMANDESLAAFYAVAYVDDCQHVNAAGSAVSSEVVLRRPFAQLNIGTLNTATDYKVSLVKSEVTVSKVNNVFNVATSKASSDAPMTFHLAAVPNEPLNVNGVSYQYAGMNYMFAGDNVKVDYKIETKIIAENGSEMTGNVTNTVSSVPLNENYRTNIIGNLLTSKVDYQIVVDADFQIPDEFVGDGVVVAKNSEDLINALKNTDAPEHLTIELLGKQTKAVTPVEYKVPVGAWTEKYYFGGDKTRTITINANGNKINFVHENTDWNYIRMVNDNAKWIINDATLTNSGKNDGPWNRHDIRFYNAVELNNVTSDKAIALLNDGKLNNVTITEDTGSYGLWITAQGQKVDINGLNITATNGGRGIAIKDQYVEAPACVTLNVENAKFETAEKAAILVTSTAGAVINLKDIDLTKVAADTDFAVWVDEARAADADKVVVKGGLCKVEKAAASVAATSAELLTDLKVENQTVYLYPTEDGEDLKLEGKISLAAGVSLIGLGENPVPVFNDWGSNAFSNQAHFTNTYVENINFTNNLIIDAGIANGNVRFKDCVFGGDRAHQGVHFDSGNGTVVFDNCTFVGRNMLGSSLEKVIFNNCTFLNKKSSLTGADKWTGVNMWGTYEFNNCVFDTEAHCNVKCDGVVAAFNGCKFVDDRDVTSLIQNSQNFQANIKFDGKTMIAAGVGFEDGAYILYDAAGMNWFANQVNGTPKNTFKGETVKLAADIDLANVAWTPVGQTGATQFMGTFDGQEYTISNLNIDATAQTGANYSSGLFGWLYAAVVKNVKIDGASVKGNHNVGVIAGYLETAGCTIENCHVANAKVECHVANNDANGDKCGVIVGHAGNAGVVVKDCTASDSTVSAGRDAGQIAGAAKTENVTGCSATNVTVTANGEGTGANVRNEVIGRILL